MNEGIWSERRLRIATEAAGVALWAWNVDSNSFAMDERSFALWGLPMREQITFEELSACIHPQDLTKVRAAFDATRDLSGAYEIDFRILHGEDVRWVSARGRGDEEGIVGRIMFGVFLDVTVRKQAEEARETIAHEMQHRVKNMFSLMSALTIIARRSARTTEEMADDLMVRLEALNAAHDLIQPGISEQKHAIFLDKLLNVLLKAYTGGQDTHASVTIATPEFRVGENSMTSLALIVHELATNSAKYGALSAPEGKLDLRCSDKDDDVELVWTETGGPPARAPSGQTGFGYELLDRVVTQMRGAIARTWTRSGLIVTLRMRRSTLAA